MKVGKDTANDFFQFSENCNEITQKICLLSFTLTSIDLSKRKNLVEANISLLQKLLTPGSHEEIRLATEKFLSHNSAQFNTIGSALQEALSLLQSHEVDEENKKILEEKIQDKIVLLQQLAINCTIKNKIEKPNQQQVPFDFFSKKRKKINANNNKQTQPGNHAKKNKKESKEQNDSIFKKPEPLSYKDVNIP